MKFNIGMFQTPLVAPERSASEVFNWAVSQAVVADQAGFTEYWIGEHATLDTVPEALPRWAGARGSSLKGVVNL